MSGMKSWRPLTWVIIVVQLLFGWWLIAGMNNVSHQSADCAGQTYSDACQAGATIGGGIAFFMIVLLWALVDVILGVIWMVTNKSRNGKAPKGMYAVNCARCGAGQNLPKNKAEFECWRCKTYQHVVHGVMS